MNSSLKSLRVMYMCEKDISFLIRSKAYLVNTNIRTLCKDKLSTWDFVTHSSWDSKEVIDGKRNMSSYLQDNAKKRFRSFKSPRDVASSNLLLLAPSITFPAVSNDLRVFERMRVYLRSLLTFLKKTPSTSAIVNNVIIDVIIQDGYKSRYLARCRRPRNLSRASLTFPLFCQSRQLDQKCRRKQARNLIAANLIIWHRGFDRDCSLQMSLVHRV